MTEQNVGVPVGGDNRGSGPSPEGALAALLHPGSRAGLNQQLKDVLTTILVDVEALATALNRQDVPLAQSDLDALRTAARRGAKILTETQELGTNLLEATVVTDLDEVMRAVSSTVHVWLPDRAPIVFRAETPVRVQADASALVLALSVLCLTSRVSGASPGPIALSCFLASARPPTGGYRPAGALQHPTVGVLRLVDSSPGLVEADRRERSRDTEPDAGTAVTLIHSLRLLRALVRQSNGCVQIMKHPSGGCTLDVMLPLPDLSHRSSASNSHETPER